MTSSSKAVISHQNMSENLSDVSSPTKIKCKNKTHAPLEGHRNRGQPLTPSGDKGKVTMSPSSSGQDPPAKRRSKKKTSSRSVRKSTLLAATLNQNAFAMLHQLHPYYRKDEPAPCVKKKLLETMRGALGVSQDNSSSSSGGGKKTNGKDKPDDEAEIGILVRSQTPGDIGVMYNIMSNQTFEHIYDDYAAKIDLCKTKFFLADNRTGKAIAPTDTAREIGIANGQIVLAIGKDPEYNLNAAIRKFYLCDVSGSNKKLAVQGELTMSVLKLYYMAAEIYRCHVSQLVLMHRNRVLVPSHTIRSAGIRSMKRVYCLPLKK